MRKLVGALAVLITAGVIAVAADLFAWVGISLYTEQYLAALLALAMPLLLLHVGANGKERFGEGVPWYDYLTAILGFATACYVAWRFPELSELVSSPTAGGVAVAAILGVLVLEGLRRTTGIALPLVTVAFFVLALVAGDLPGDLAGKSIPIARLTFYAAWDSTAMLGVPLKIVTLVVISFVFFGNVLFKAGGSQFFSNLSMALMGRYRGGPAKVAILGSSLFGMLSGSVVANVATVGVVTIPLMKRMGFKPHVAAAIEAASSTGGQLMPPVMGVSAFLMAEFLEVPYSTVALAAVLPSVLFYIALLIQADLEAARSGLKPLDRDQIPRLFTVLRNGWYFAIPVAILIYTLFWLGYAPETSALAATAALLVLALVFGFQGKRIGISDLIEMMRDTALSVLSLFMIGAAAGVIIGTLNYSGAGFGFTLSLLHLAGGSLIVLLALAAIASIILGMGMPTVGVYILLATLIAPALIQMKIAPMAAHMYILYYGMLSMITPPVCIGAFAAANIAGAEPMRTGFAAMRFGWTVFVVPWLFVFSGTLLMYGSPLMIVIDFATAVVGVWLISAAMMGYAVRPLPFAPRTAYAIAGACMLLPVGVLAGGRWINVAGATLALAILIWERLLRRRAVAAST
jgi:TRAP transporter 4TM/12TM fusion protein